jgi:hypothetical protein
MSENSVKTIDNYLEGIRRHRDDLLTRQAAAREQRDVLEQELAAIDKELERADAILGRDNGGGDPERKKTVQAVVLEHLKANCSPGVMYPAREIVAKCVTRLSQPEGSVKSALRRLAKKGFIKLGGSRYDQEVTLLSASTVPSEAASKPTPEELIMTALANASPKYLSRDELIWEGGDMVAVTAALASLRDQERIVYKVEDDGVTYYACSITETEERSLFDGADKP